jgi:hypothetical protein
LATRRARTSWRSQRASASTSGRSGRVDSPPVLFDVGSELGEAEWPRWCSRMSTPYARLRDEPLAGAEVLHPPREVVEERLSRASFSIGQPSRPACASRALCASAVVPTRRQKCTSASRTCSPPRRDDPPEAHSVRSASRWPVATSTTRARTEGCGPAVWSWWTGQSCGSGDRRAIIGRTSSRSDRPPLATTGHDRLRPAATGCSPDVCVVAV